MLANKSVRQRSNSPIALWLLLLTLFIVPLWLSYSVPSQVAIADQSNASAVLVDVPQESPNSVQPQSDTSDRSKEGNAGPNEVLPAAVPVRYDGSDGSDASDAFDASDASDATHQGSDVYCVFLPLLTGGSGTTTTQANSVASRSAGAGFNCIASDQPIEPATILRSSPSNGEDGVAVTRETIIEFSDPIDPDSVTDAAISAQFGGNTLATRLHISADNSTVTLFYNEALPASARVRVTIDGEQLLDANGNPVDVDGNGSAGGTTTIDFDTLSLTVIEGTSVCGRVFASELDTSDRGTSVNVPLQGVTITVDGMEDTLPNRQQRELLPRSGSGRPLLRPYRRSHCHQRRARRHLLPLRRQSLAIDDWPTNQRRHRSPAARPRRHPATGQPNGRDDDQPRPLRPRTISRIR
jgi:hypothetical protein